MLRPLIVGPFVEIETTFYADKTPFANVFTRNFGLSAPDFNVKPIRFLLFSRSVNSHAEGGFNSTGLEITHFRISAGSADDNY
jgi:hypothetical protein